MAGFYYPQGQIDPDEIKLLQSAQPVRRYEEEMANLLARSKQQPSQPDFGEPAWNKYANLVRQGTPIYGPLNTSGALGMEGAGYDALSPGMATTGVGGGIGYPSMMMNSALAPGSLGAGTTAGGAASDRDVAMFRGAGAGATGASSALESNPVGLIMLAALLSQHGADEINKDNITGAASDRDVAMFRDAAFGVDKKKGDKSTGSRILGPIFKGGKGGGGSTDYPSYDSSYWED